MRLIWNCCQQNEWAKFARASRWLYWSSKLPGHQVSVYWQLMFPPFGCRDRVIPVLQVTWISETMRSWKRDSNVGEYRDLAAVGITLAPCMTLRQLCVELPLDTRKRADLTPLSVLSQLRELVLRHQDVGHEEPLSGFTALRALVQLTTLSLPRIPVNELQPLEPVRCLHFVPDDARIGDDKTSNLAWPNLTQLSIVKGHLSQEATDAVLSSGKMRTLSVGSCGSTRAVPLTCLELTQWNGVLPEALFHAELKHLLLAVDDSVEDAVKCRPTLGRFASSGACPAGLESLKIAGSPTDSARMRRFVRWITGGASRKTLRALSLASWTKLGRDAAAWLMSMPGLIRLDVVLLPTRVLLPGLQQLYLWNNHQVDRLRLQKLINRLPRNVPGLDFLMIEDAVTLHDCHALADLRELTYMVIHNIAIDTNKHYEITLSQLLDTVFGCRCICTKTALDHMPKLRHLVHPSYHSPYRLGAVTPAWMERANARKIQRSSHRGLWSKWWTSASSL